MYTEKVLKRLLLEGVNKKIAVHLSNGGLTISRPH